MNDLQRVKENPDFVKNSTGAILNTNNNALEQYIVQREQILKMRSTSDRINMLEKKVDGMYDILSEILGKLK